MKNTLLLAVLFISLFFAGCAAPEIVPPDLGMKLYTTSGEPLNLPGFSNGIFLRNAEVARYGVRRENYEFGPGRVMVGTQEHQIWRTSTMRPEGYVKDVSYTPKTCVLFFHYKSGERYKPGFVEQVLAVELPAEVMEESISSRTFKYTFRPGAESPRAILYIETAPPEGAGRKMEPDTEDRIPQDFEGSPFNFLYRFYCEEVQSGAITVITQPGGLCEGTLEIAFPKNRYNELGVENQGPDVPDYRNFTCSGNFRAKPVSK
jgi:hypothetical protein